MADDPVVRLGETITKLRHDAGLSQREFCAAIGMSQSLISRLEHGGQEPGLSKLVVIAEFFGLTVGRLLDGDIAQAADLPEISIARSVACEKCGLISAGLTPDQARRLQAEHRRAHLAEGGAPC